MTLSDMTSKLKTPFRSTGQSHHRRTSSAGVEETAKPMDSHNQSSPVGNAAAAGPVEIVVDPAVDQANTTANTTKMGTAAAPLDNPSSSPTAGQDLLEWDAAKVPPSRFQHRRGSIFATPCSRDGQVHGPDRDQAYHDKIKEKGWRIRRPSNGDPPPM